MRKRLYRVEQGKMLCGVCGGIAEYFDLDPSLVRLGWIVLCAGRQRGTGLYYCRHRYPHKVLCGRAELIFGVKADKKP